MNQRMRASKEENRTRKLEKSPKPRGDEVTFGKDKKESKPRKCLIIRKTKLEDDIEKIVMKYVSYSKINQGENTTALEVISDASNYLNQRAKDCSPNADSSSTSPSGTRTLTSGTEQSTVRRKLRLCLPIIHKIRAKFDESEQNKKNSPYKREQSSAMKKLCEEVIDESSFVLDNEKSISGKLMDKIKNINQMSRQILSNESEAEKDEEDEKVLFHM